MNSWQSLVFYLLCFALSAGFIYLGGRKNAPKRSIQIVGKRMVVNPWNIAGILIPILIGCFRYGMGTDYASYLEIYQYYANGQVVDWHISYIQTVEPMFQWLASLSYTLTNSPLLFFGLTWSVTILLVYFGIKHWTSSYNQNFAMAWFLTLPIVTAIGFNQTRQMLAIAILFFASKYITELRQRGIFAFIALAICATLCHKSAAAIAILFLAIRLSVRNRGDIATTGYITLRIIVISIILATIAIAGASVFGLSVPYLDEFYRLLFINGNVSGNLFAIADIRPENIILLCIFIPAVFFARSNNETISYHQKKMLSIFCTVGLLLTLVSIFVMNGERLAQYFILFPVVAYYSSVSRHTRIRVAIYPLIIFFVITLLGWQGILPYYTIYNKNVDINAINSLSIRPPYNQLLCKVGFIPCNDQLYFDEVIRDRYEYQRGDLWEL